MSSGTLERPDAVEHPDTTGGTSAESVQGRLVADHAAREKTIQAAKVLVVDDEPVILKMVKRHLTDAGCGSVVTTSKASEVEDIIRRENPDLVLLDIHMPELTGLEILETLRGDQQFAKLPVVILTVATDPQTKAKAFELGATDFLSKPVDALELTLRIGNVLAASAYRDGASKELGFRKESRYRITTGAKIPAFIERADGEATVRTPITLLDLSRHGARFSVDEDVATSGSVTIRIVVDAVKLDCIVEADIRWSQPAGQQRMYLGCCFTSDLADELLAKLAAAGFLERRLDQRHRTDLDAHMRLELQADGTYPVRVLDYSMGGFRMACQQPVQVGKRILLELDDQRRTPACIPARIIWQRELEEGFQIGCGFLNNNGYDLLLPFAKTGKKALPLRMSRGNGRRRSWIGNLLAILLLATGFVYLWYWFAGREIGAVQALAPYLEQCLERFRP